MSSEGEKLLCGKLESIINSDFKMHSQINGKSITEDAKVRIDYLLYPNEILIEHGFDPVWFGIEVKHFAKQPELHEMTRFYWQCISYQQSVFNLDGGVRPAFVLGFSNLEFVDLRGELWIPLHLLAALAKVGSINYYHRKNSEIPYGWHIQFATSTYFSYKHGEFKRYLYNMKKKNTGNCAI